ADTLRQRPNAKAVTETGSQGVDHAVSPFPRTCPALAPPWPRAGPARRRPHARLALETDGRRVGRSMSTPRRSAYVHGAGPSSKRRSFLHSASRTRRPGAHL